MISKKCDLDEFIEVIEDLPYHMVLTSILNEGYATDDHLAHRRRDCAANNEIERIIQYRKALRDITFLLQMGMRPDYVTMKDVENYNKFRRVAAKLVEKGELMPRILDFFDD
ncbi:MAG: hypothetical protein JW986_10265 [Methanotrichaceae archaeon]|nr:hypothetical protein [Methanotrichaceae archaeon]